MLTRSLISTLRKVSTINGGAVSQAARLYHDEHFKPPHMNELPVPQGSWEEANRISQRKNNLHLAFGVGFLIFSLAVAKSSGLFWLNYTVPEKPADR